MKYLGFSLMISLIAGGLGAQVAPKLKVKQIFLEYKSPNKTIVIKDTSIVVIEKKDVFDNPVSSNPSSSKLEEKNYSLTRKEVYDLIKLIQDTKFFELEKFYGAPETERYYPTSIFIKMLGKEKEVLYRSNPSFTAAPDAFNQLEKYLIAIRK